MTPLIMTGDDLGALLQNIAALERCDCGGLPSLICEPGTEPEAAVLHNPSCLLPGPRHLRALKEGEI